MLGECAQRFLDYCPPKESLNEPTPQQLKTCNRKKGKNGNHAESISCLSVLQSTRDCCQLLYSRTAISRGISGTMMGSTEPGFELGNRDGGPTGVVIMDS